jgi:hypothetical protein
MHTMAGPVVNGGLIDFQDNFNRGMAEYANFQHNQQLAAMMPGPVPLQQAFQQQMQQYPSVVGPVPGVAAPAQLPCISGPPVFLHMYGQKYVPEETQVAAKHVEMPPEPVLRVLSEDEIERRVRDRVDTWAASQRKPIFGSAEETRRNLKGHGASDEERAAERIHSVNAGMRGRYNSPL